MAFPRSSFDSNSNIDEAERAIDVHLRHARELPVEIPLHALPGMKQEELDALVQRFRAAGWSVLYVSDAVKGPGKHLRFS